jgi:hypothetical protein
VAFSHFFAKRLQLKNIPLTLSEKFLLTNNPITMDDFSHSIYLNPLTDFGFKKLFSSESNKNLLIDFLNEIITEEGNITDEEKTMTMPG